MPDFPELEEISSLFDISGDPSSKVGFVLTLTAGGQDFHFVNNRDHLRVLNDDDSMVLFHAAMLGDLDGITATMDPRKQSSSMPSVPSIILDYDTVVTAMGDNFAFDDFGKFRVAVSLVVDGSYWRYRLKILDNFRIDVEDIQISYPEQIIIKLSDPLQEGKMQIPDTMVCPNELPGSWTSAYLVEKNNGRSIPILFGKAFWIPPILVFDNEAVTPGLVRRYIVAAHRVEATTATLHMTDGSTDSAPISTAVINRDGAGQLVISYVQTDGAVGAGGENPLATPPVEVEAISFDATTGVRATLGYVIRELIEKWTDITITPVIRENLDELVDAFKFLNVSFLIDGEGADKATIAEILDRRIANQFPISVSRHFGELRFISLWDLMNPVWRAYSPPTFVFRYGSDLNLDGDITIKGEIFNKFEARYSRRGSDGNWVGNPVVMSPDNSYECKLSEERYGRREVMVMDMEDVYERSAAGSILEYQSFISLQPWTEATFTAGIYASLIMPGQKIRIEYDETIDDGWFGKLNARVRNNLASGVTTEGHTWFDVIVVSAGYHRTHTALEVIY